MINQSSGQGALFELVARGVKDTYFIKDSNDSFFPYDANYESSTHHISERKTIVPINGTNFGTTFEVEIDPYGDIMTECAFEIDLPTWFPYLPIHPNMSQLYNPSIANGLYSIISNDMDGNSYGYVNYVGYFLFKKIEFYQDQILIQEWTGDGLLAKQLGEGSYNSSFLQQLMGGQVDPVTQSTNRSIQLRATPNHLRIKLPLPGLQCPGDIGFPFIAMPWQKFRIKATLRNVEDLVVCSDNSRKPKPWNVSEFKMIYDTSDFYIFSPKPFSDIGQPTILLSTIQKYVTPYLQEELRSKPIQIPFRRQFENNFTFGELDYIPLDNGGTASITRRLDGRHPTEKIFWFFRTQNSIDQNQLDNFYNNFFDYNLSTPTEPFTESYGNFYYNMKLVIAGRDREIVLEPFVLQDISQFVKDEKGSGVNIGEMKWTTGEKFGTIYPCPRQPEGTINFTMADRPTLHIELANVRPDISRQRKSELCLFTEGWSVYDIREGRGKLLFAN